MSLQPNQHTKARGPRIVWSPLPGSQTLAVTCPAHHILYHGTRGPGKTDSQLMAFRKNVGKGYGSHWRGIIFDRAYKNLDDLIGKSQRWFPQFQDGARFLRSKGDYKWIWPTGEELYFRQITREEDYWNFHGQEFAFIGWNELCKFPNSKLYDAMMSCNRSSFLPEEHSPDLDNPLPPIPLVVFSTANPYGPGHSWVKRRFIDPVPSGQMMAVTTKAFDPQTQQDCEVTKYQCALFGSYRENRYLSKEYVAELEKITDENKRKAWLEGNWDITAGGALDDLWDSNVHIVPRFIVPREWYLDRAYDWGSTKPFSVGWWALANGEEVELLDGRIFCPAKGSLIMFHDWYGSQPEEDNVGLNLSDKTIAIQIKGTESHIYHAGWILRGVSEGPADNSIFDDDRKDVDSIARVMEKEGVYWERSNKNPGSRKIGLQLIRDRLENALTGEGPALYIMEHCRDTIRLLPNVPRDPDDLDDVDTEAPDHIYDQVRYRVLKGAGQAATQIIVKFKT